MARNNAPQPGAAAAAGGGGEEADPGRVDWTRLFRTRGAAIHVAASIVRADTDAKQLILFLTFDQVERIEKQKGTDPLEIFYLITKVAKHVIKMAGTH